MSETNQYLVYYIYLSDLALIQSLQGSLITPAPGIVGNGIGAILAAPDDAAVKYGVPKLAAHAALTAPCISSTWFGTEDHFPTNVASFDRKSGGWFGWSVLFGDTTHYHWRGIFVYLPPADPVSGPTAQPLSLRRWIDGFEIPGGGEGGSGVLPYSRGSSRHVEGLGLCLRGSTAPRIHSITENYAAVNPHQSWERFYVRLRQTPDAATTFWRQKSSVQANAGIALQITPSGQLALSRVDGASALTLLATTTALALDTWVRVDVFTTLLWNPPGLSNGDYITTTLWLNGTVVIQAGPFYMGSVSGSFVNALTTTEMGPSAANTLGLDVDDWMNAEQPGNTDGIDFQSGSGMFLVSPSAIAGGTANWTGDWRGLAQLVRTNANATAVSSTISAPLIADTDAHEVISENPEGIGIVAMIACLGATGVTAGNLLGFVGVDLTGTLTALGIVAGTTFQNFLWRLGAGATQCLKPTNPIQLKFIFGTAAGTTTVTNLLAVAEIIGIFGTEDAPHVIPAPKGLPLHLGPHNAPYPHTPWARLTTTPIQPVFVQSGTYVGNGTGQDLLFPVPIHWFRVRPLTGGAGGALWYSSMQAAKTAIEQQDEASHVARARIDPAFVPAGLDQQQQQTILSIAGSHTQSNANGVTYQYLAIGDPGMRFCVNGVLKYHRGTLDETTTLIHPRFTPLAGFFSLEAVAGGVTAGTLYKGPGHAAQSLSPLGAAEVTVALDFALASIGNHSAFAAIATADDVPFSVFRTDDTSGNPGKVVQLTSYVGDGNASRTIAITPLSGKRPLWALVVPHNGAAIVRDASHTGVTSTVYGTGVANATTGITGAGIDSLSVGSALNANGIVYDVFVVPGDSVAGNGGFSVNGAFMPVPPEPPPDAPFDATSPQEPPNAPVADAGPTGNPVIPDPLAATGPMPGLTDDLDAACVADTVRIVNVALSRLGISQQIGNLATDTTAEAVTARLEYPDAVQATLRDFPWPFATRYAQLVVVATTPNSDWAYSYRQPTDCLFERRLVVSRTGAVDPEPPAFQLATDDTGGLIFTNLANAVLEYTARPKCPHTRSEPLFRDAMSWKLAAALAPALTRMTEAAISCTKMYWATIEQARQVLRPNNPGAVAAAASIDVSAAAQAANVSVVNLALVRIGARTIRNLSTDQSREAQTARLIFERELQTVLRDFPWAFATRYVAPALVGGTASVPVNGDWQYSYRLPTDLIFARRIVSAARRAYERNPPPFKLAQDATGGLLYTDVAQTVAPDTPGPVLEYTARIEAAVLFSDALFQDAFAWKLVATLAPAIALALPETPEQVGRGPEDPKTPKDHPATGAQLRARAAQTAFQMYHLALAKAQVAAANEAEPDLTAGQADWIDGRDGRSATSDPWGSDR